MKPQSLIDIRGDIVDGVGQPPYPNLQSSFRMSGSKIVVDIEAAKEVARDMIRKRRSEKWPEIDAARFMAIEAGTGLEAVRTRATKLRNYTKDARIQEAKNPDDLLNAVNAITIEITEV
jgi:hypothetical protein